MNMRLPHLSLASFALAAALPGCSPFHAVSYTPSNSTAFPPKPANCRLEVLTLPPQRPYIELGAFDIRNTNDGKNVETTAELLADVQERACHEGADAVLGWKGPSTVYGRATALRWREATPTPPEGAKAAQPGAPAVPASAVPAPAASSPLLRSAGASSPSAGRRGRSWLTPYGISLRDSTKCKCAPVPSQQGDELVALERFPGWLRLPEGGGPTV
jgi:hypothetical protein